MENFKTGALPTYIIAGDDKAHRAKRLELFNHYLNHKGTDIPNGKKYSTDRTVIESIIASFGRQYIPESFKIQTLDNETHKVIETKNDTLNDLRQVAHIVIWEATHKYIWESNKKNINYKDRFDFCIFASNYLKFQLRLHLRKINRDRIYGTLPDSDPVRKLYTILPKYKKNNPHKQYLTANDYKKISLENKIDIKIVKEVDKYFTSKTISGDKPINSDDVDKNNMWDILQSDNEESFLSSQDIEEELDTSFKNKKLKSITLDFLKKLSKRDCEIFNEVKLKESENVKLKDLSIKFNISSERVRQISEKIFKDYEILLKKNKKHLWDD